MKRVLLSAEGSPRFFPRTSVGRLLLVLFSTCRIGFGARAPYRVGERRDRRINFQMALRRTYLRVKHSHHWPGGSVPRSEICVRGERAGLTIILDPPSPTTPRRTTSRGNMYGLYN